MSIFGRNRPEEPIGAFGPFLLGALLGVMLFASLWPASLVVLGWLWDIVQS